MSFVGFGRAVRLRLSVERAEQILVGGPVDVSRDEQIELSVVVVVEPDGAGRPAGRREARLLRDIGERAVAVVAVQTRTAARSDEDVREPVVVVVPDGNAHPERSSPDAGPLGDVRERAVAVVLVERVFERLLRSIEVAGAAVDEVDVHPPVVVVIEERAARAQGFRQEARRRHRVLVDPADSARRGGNFFEERRRVERGCRSRTGETRKAGGAHARSAGRLEKRPARQHARRS